MNKQNQLADVHNSGKPYIIYKSKKGFDLYTNFSKKIILNNRNIGSFLNRKYKNEVLEINDFKEFYKKDNLNLCPIKNCTLGIPVRYHDALILNKEIGPEFLEFHLSYLLI